VVDGLGVFPNGETTPIEDDGRVEVYVAQRGGFCNGNGVTFSGLDDFMLEREDIPPHTVEVHGPGDVVQVDPKSGQPVDLDSMNMQQLRDYAEKLGRSDELTGLRKKADMVNVLSAPKQEVNDDE
jgi:hypothetical protein